MKLLTPVLSDLCCINLSFYMEKIAPIYRNVFKYPQSMIDKRR